MITLFGRYLIKIFSSKKYYNAYLKSLELEDYDIEYLPNSKLIGWNYYVHYRKKGSDDPHERLKIPFYHKSDATNFKTVYNTFREMKLREYCDGI